MYPPYILYNMYIPESMQNYLDQYGWHFSKKACEYAVKMMKKKTASSTKPERIDPWSKDEVEDLLKRNGVELQNNKLYDFVFVANMAKADYYKSSITDEAHLALFIKDYIDDTDASDETAFRRWLATLVGNRQPLEWEDIL